MTSFGDLHGQAFAISAMHMPAGDSMPDVLAVTGACCMGLRRILSGVIHAHRMGTAETVTLAVDLRGGRRHGRRDGPGVGGH